MERPPYLQCGELPRLIPTVSDSSREKRVLSVFFSAMMSVDAFRSTMLESLGHRVGTRSTVTAFVEPVFKGKDVGKDRPDGLLVLNTGRRQWTALVEAKIGNAGLDRDQVAKYIGYARDFQIDAVITLSNQFVALPDHYPFQFPKSVSRGVALFHWSWMFVVTQASLLLTSNAVQQPDQRYLLNETLRYWKHDSSGISSFDRMNREWRELVDKVRNKASLNRTMPEVENSVAAWHQEVRDLSLLISRRMGRPVAARLSRAHRADPILRLKDDSDYLIKEKCLCCELDIPGAAAPLTVQVDLASRTIRCSMRLQAPADRKRSSARTNWLVRQLTKSDGAGVYVKAFRRGRAEETEALLTDLREDADLLDSSNSETVPIAYEIFAIEELGGRFAGNKIFIDTLEQVVPAFYQRVGMHLRAWVQAPPRISRRDPVKEETAPELEASVLEALGGDPTHTDDISVVDVGGKQIVVTDEAAR